MVSTEKKRALILKQLNAIHEKFIKLMQSYYKLDVVKKDNKSKRKSIKKKGK